MLNTLKKKILKNVLFKVMVALAVIGGGIVCAGQSLKDFVQGGIPISAKMDYEAAEGSYVSFNIVHVVDEYVRQSQRQTRTREEKLENISYLVYFKEDKSFFGAELPSSREEVMGGYIEETIQWLNQEINQTTFKVPIKGTWKALTGERLKFYKEVITEGLGEEFLDMALPYYIDTSTVGTHKKSTIYIWGGLMVAAILYALYILISLFTGSHEKKIKKYLASHSDVSMDQIEEDFADATCVGRAIWVGKRWTIYTHGIYGRIEENKDIVWAYYYRPSGRSHESSLRLYNKNKKMASINATKAVAMEVINIYEKEQRHIVLGYSRQLKSMFSGNFQGFLDMRFNCAGEEQETLKLPDNPE